VNRWSGGFVFFRAFPFGQRQRLSPSRGYCCDTHGCAPPGSALGAALWGPSQHPGLVGLCSLTADFDGLSLAGSPADFGKFMADETEKWGKVIRAANIKPE
jgi:hypothetical protein